MKPVLAGIYRRFNKLVYFWKSKNLWISGRPILSARRFLSLIYLLLKRGFHLDKSFYPPNDSDVPIDVFIPVIEKDKDILPLALDGIKENVRHPIKTIYLIAPKASQAIKKFAKQYDCVFVPEEGLLPIVKSDIGYFHAGQNRNGWIYKMLLNLNSDNVCTSRYILVVDADTIFIYPQIFMYDNRPMFNLSDEYHQPYFDANVRILNLKHRLSRSFITHYFLFDGRVLAAARQEIEKKWQKPWYQVIIDNLDRNEGSSFADYEFYGDFYMTNAKPKPLLNYWSNASYTVKSFKQLKQIINESTGRFRSISFHVYRKKLE